MGTVGEAEGEGEGEGERASERESRIECSSQFQLPLLQKATFLSFHPLSRSLACHHRTTPALWLPISAQIIRSTAPVDSADVDAGSRVVRIAARPDRQLQHTTFGSALGVCNHDDALKRLRPLGKPGFCRSD